MYYKCLINIKRNQSSKSFHISEDPISHFSSKIFQKTRKSKNLPPISSETICLLTFILPLQAATLSLNRQRCRNKDIPWEPVRKSMRCIELWAFKFAAKGGRRWSSFDGFIPVWTHSRTPTPLITSGDLAASLGGVIVEKLCHNKGNRREGGWTSEKKDRVTLKGCQRKQW